MLKLLIYLNVNHWLRKCLAIHSWPDSMPLFGILLLWESPSIFESLIHWFFSHCSSRSCSLPCGASTRPTSPIPALFFPLNQSNRRFSMTKTKTTTPGRARQGKPRVEATVSIGAGAQCQGHFPISDNYTYPFEGRCVAAGLPNFLGRRGSGRL